MIDDIVSEEATDDELSKFHNHLEKCMPCYERYDLDKAVRDLIRSRCKETQVPEGLVESIQMQVSKSSTL